MAAGRCDKGFLPRLPNESFVFRMPICRIDLGSVLDGTAALPDWLHVELA